MRSSRRVESNEDRAFTTVGHRSIFNQCATIVVSPSPVPLLWSHSDRLLRSCFVCGCFPTNSGGGLLLYAGLFLCGSIGFYPALDMTCSLIHRCNVSADAVLLPDSAERRPAFLPVRAVSFAHLGSFCAGRRACAGTISPSGFPGLPLWSP